MHKQIARREGKFRANSIEPLERRRLLAAGALDPTFNGNGKVDFFYGTESNVQHVLVQPDGKILAIGQRSSDSSGRHYSLFRFNADGTLDTSFAGDGIAEVATGAGLLFFELAMQPDGAIFVAGNRKIARFSQTGVRENSFETNAQATIGFLGTVEEVAVQGDGKIVVGGAGGAGLRVLRFNPNGTPDTAFNNKQVTIGQGIQGFFGDLVVMDDLDLLICGTDYAANALFGRFTIDGDPDSEFTGPLPGDLPPDMYFAGLAPTDDGKYVAKGAIDYDDQRPDENVVARFHANGTLDYTFAGGAEQPFLKPPAGDRYGDFVLQPDQKIVIAGFAAGSGQFLPIDMLIARFTPDGAPDATFGTAGRTLVNFQYTDIARTVALTPDGRIVAAGSARESSAGIVRLTNDTGVMLQPDGSLRLDGTVGDDHVTVSAAGDAFDLTITTASNAGGLSQRLPLVTGQWLQIDTGEGNDLIDASGAVLPTHLAGAAGDDTLIGGTNSDTISGGSGNDRIFARFGGTDTVNGGEGIDIADVDAADVVNADVEQVNLSSPDGQTPFSGSPFAIGSSPVTIQFEDFDNGGEGVAYHDVESSNLGGQYRSSGVDVSATSDGGGGYYVGFVKTGEWLEYTIDVAQAGNYTLDIRLAAASSNGKFHVEVGGIDKTGLLTVPNTGGFQNWTTLSKSGVNLPAGQHVLRVFMDAAGSNGSVGNFNWVMLTRQADPPPAWMQASPDAQYTLTTTVLTVSAGTISLMGDVATTHSNLAVSVLAGAELEIAATQHLASLDLADGAQALLSAAGEAKVLVVGALTLAGNATLDLKTSPMIANYSGASPIGSWAGSSYGGLTGRIAAARNGGGALWQGSGIASSAAAASDGLTTLAIAEASQVLGLAAGQTATWQGQTVDATSVLLKYTFAGDANLDGKINIDDYGRIDGNVASSGSVFGYFSGDFNYDGKINIDDYGIIDGNINRQGAPMLAESVALSAATMQATVMASGNIKLARALWEGPWREQSADALLKELK